MDLIRQTKARLAARRLYLEYDAIIKQSTDDADVPTLARRMEYFAAAEPDEVTAARREELLRSVS
jgi:hypothetical protein